MLSVLRCSGIAEHPHGAEELQSPVRSYPLIVISRLQDAHQSRCIVPCSAPDCAEVSLAQPLSTAERRSSEIRRYFSGFN